MRYDKEQVRSANTIETVIGDRLALDKRNRCLCPFHEDHNPSLVVDTRKQRWKCFGCGKGGDVFEFVMLYEQLDFEKAVEQLALRAGILPEKDILDDRGSIEYIYLDQDRKPVMKTVRRDLSNGSKRFTAYRWDGTQWLSGLNGTKAIPYNLPQLLDAGTVHIAEGEKCCDRLASFGLIATTNPFGAGKWLSEYSEHLRGKTVYIHEDNDEPGRKHAQDIISSLFGRVAELKLVSYSELPPKGDVADWLEEHDKDELVAKIESLPTINEYPKQNISIDAPSAENTEKELLQKQYGPPIMFDKDGNPTQFNQMFAAAKYANNNLVLHEPSLNLFYEYEAETGLWMRATEAQLIIKLGHALHEMFIEYKANRLLKKRSANLLGQILCLLRGIVEKPDIFRRTTPIIHVGNGVLHLDTDPPTLNEFSPDYYSRNRSEVCFDEQADCPRFLGELLRPALSEEDVSLLQRYAGQCLLGRNPSQKLLLLRGTPGGGKSTLANVLESIIGIHNVTQLRVQHLGERFEVAGFVGKTLLAGKDVPGNVLNHKAAHILKALVGGDRLDAEQKNVKHRFELLGEFNIIITSNSHLHLRLDGDSGAWKRRLLIVDYERPSANKPIPNFDRLLVETEGPGILNWCVVGALDLLDELNTHGRIVLSNEQTKRIDALLCESDSVRHFITEMVEKTDHLDVTVNELQTAYHNFCEEQGWQAVTIRQFENQVSNIMMEVHRVAKRNDIKRNGTSQRGFSHVVLQD